MWVVQEAKTHELSAKGASSYQTGATSQEINRVIRQGLKARFINSPGTRC